MAYGRFSHGPRRYGRSARNATQVVLQGLLSDYGTALSKDSASYNWVEADAFARAINSAWSTLRRLRNQFDPQRMTDYLPRWERVLGISPPTGASASARRAEVARKFKFLGIKPDGGTLLSFLREILPDVTPTVVHTSSADAVTHAAKLVAGVWTGVDVPGGIHTPAESAVYWSSSVAYLLVLAVRPVWMTTPAFDTLFYSQLGRVHRYLNDWLPAWVTYAYASDVHGFPASSDSGFYLDEPDLDVERLTIYIRGPSIGGGAFTQKIFPYSLSLAAGLPTTYSNYYRFAVTGAPAAVHVDVTRATGTGIYVAVFAGPSRDGALVVSGSDPSNHLTGDTPVLAVGNYVLEVNSDAPDVIDGATSPFTATITLT